MTSKKTLALLMAAAIFPAAPVFADDDLQQLKQEIAKMRAEYEQRIAQLEQRLEQAESDTESVSQQMAEVQTQAAAPTQTATNSFNPAISMILNGSFNSYGNNPEDYELSGFALQGEGGLASEGFSLGESELTVSANVDQNWFAQATVALHDHDDETEVEIEEAYIESLGLGNGMTLRAGRFFSPIGYLNEKHIHAWNFADAPLIYRGLFGNQLTNDGVKLSYLFPTDMMFEVGATLGSGDNYPGSGGHDGIGDWLVYAKTGGDIGIENSWQASISHWQASPDDREYTGGHHHHDGDDEEHVAFNGDTEITNLSLVYKWAPNGNFRQRNLTLSSEFFYLRDDGDLSHGAEFARYDGKQYGGYLEGVYQFNPNWRTGLRYDWLGTSLHASDDELLLDAGLDDTGYHPERYSLMLEWLPSEFSRIRAQFNHDRSSRDDDNQLILQYTMSLGSHGAHNY